MKNNINLLSFFMLFGLNNGRIETAFKMLTSLAIRSEPMLILSLILVI